MQGVMVAAVVAACMLASCGSSRDPEPGTTSPLHFITFGPGVTGLVAAAKKATMSFCVSGVSSQSDVARWEKDIKSSVLKWIKPLRAMTAAPLTSDVRVVQGGRCDFDLQVAPNTWSNTSIGQRPTIRMSPDGYFGSYNVLLHEMGHAFALADTYQNSQSGNCKPGQPQAVMCNTSFDDLQPDDVLGVQAIFRQAFPGEPPPANPGEDLDTKYELYAALGKETDANAFEVHASVVGSDGESRGVMSFCPRSLSECRSSTTLWRRMTSSGSRPGAAVFALGSGVTLSNGMAMTLRYEGEQGTKLVQLNARSDT